VDANYNLSYPESNAWKEKTKILEKYITVFGGIIM